MLAALAQARPEQVGSLIQTLYCSDTLPPMWCSGAQKRSRALQSDPQGCWQHRHHCLAKCWQNLIRRTYRLVTLHQSIGSVITGAHPEDRSTDEMTCELTHERDKKQLRPCDAQLSGQMHTHWDATSQHGLDRVVLQHCALSMVRSASSTRSTTSKSTAAPREA